MRLEFRGIVLAAAIAAQACAATITPPRTAVDAPAPDALLVLPGFGYGGDAERAIKALAPAMRADGVDLFAPAFLARSGFDRSEDALRRFIREQRLDRYARVHVFAFLAGGWTLNTILDDPAVLPNLATVVYDRSPYQERAPRIAADKLTVLAWLRYGPVLFELAKTPYRPLPRRDIAIGLMVETTPTSFVRRYASTARSYGPIGFDCDGFGQAHHDCVYVAMDHSELYTRFDEVWPQVRTFIRDRRFPDAADRTPPIDHLAAARTAERGAR